MVAIVSVDAPLMVEVVGVIVAVPTPKFWTSKEKPAVKPVVVATDRLTATAPAFDKVISLPASVVAMA